MFRTLKLPAVGLALSLFAAPAVSAQAGPAGSGSPASLFTIPTHRILIDTPNARPGPNVPWVSERGPSPAAEPQGGPRLPRMVQPAVAKLDADQPAAPADMVVIPVTTILIILLVVVIVLAVD